MNSVEKVVYLSGRLRPGGIDLKRVSLASISVVKESAETIVTVPMITLAAQAEKNRLNLLLIPNDKTWANRDPYKTGLDSPQLTILNTISDSVVQVRINYNIPQFPDWLKSTVLSSIDGVLSTLEVATGLSGAITDHSGTLLKNQWEDSAIATINLPAGNTDYIWVKHEYRFGGVINSDLTPLPIATTTTTTTASTTTTTTTTESTTTASTTTTTTTTTPTTEPTTTQPPGVNVIFLDGKHYKMAVACFDYAFYDSSTWQYIPNGGTTWIPMAGWGTMAGDYCDQVVRIPTTKNLVLMYGETLIPSNAFRTAEGPGYNIYIPWL